MQRRHALLAIGTGTATALAGCLDAGLLQAEGGTERDPTPPADADTSGTRVHVSGQGTVETDPDVANVVLSVEASGDSAESVRDQLGTDAEAVRTALLDAGVDEDDVTTDRFRIHERREGSGYTGEHAYRVQVDEIDRAGEIVDVGVDAGADDVGRIHFTISDDRREELRSEALQRAIDDARAEAETVAAAKGMEIVGVQEVRTDDSGVSPMRRDVTLEADDAATGTEFESGAVSVSASVSVVYVVDD